MGCYNRDMQRKLNEKAKKLIKSPAGPAIFLVLILLIFLATRLNTPQRSPEAYCKVLAEEEARLGDKSLPAHAEEYAEMFRKLEKVAPDEIRGNVRTLKQITEKMADDPSQALGASLSGASTERELKDWHAQHCGTKQ